MWCTPPALKPYTTIHISHCSQPLSTPTSSSPFLFGKAGSRSSADVVRWAHERNSIGKAIGSRPRVLFIPTVGPASLCHRCSMLRSRLLHVAYDASPETPTATLGHASFQLQTYWLRPKGRASAACWRCRFSLRRSRRKAARSNCCVLMMGVAFAMPCLAVGGQGHIICSG